MAKAPDMDKVFGRYNKTSRKGLKLANKHFNWAKKQNRKNWDTNKPIIDNLVNWSETAGADAAEDRGWYESIFKPYTEDYMGDIEGYQGKVDQFSAEVAKLKQQATDYAGQANRDLLMGRAQASVADQFEAARKNNLSMLEGYGINPSATRYAALDYSARAAEGASKAAAGTQASMNVDETSRAMFQEALDREVQARGLDADVLGMKKGVVDYGSTVNKQAQEGTALAGSLGETAAKTQLATSELANKQRVSTTDFLNSTSNALNGWSTALNDSYRNAIEAEKAEAESSSGIGGLIGTALPVVGDVIKFFAAEGGEVPDEMSPTGGAINDDVSTMLTAGEFVFPREAVMKYGTDRLQKMIDKAKTGTTPNTQMATSAEPAIPEEATGALPKLPLPGHGFSPNLFA